MAQSPVNILYANTLRLCSNLFARINNSDYPFGTARCLGYYTGASSDEHRQRTGEDWVGGKLTDTVASSAFGSGIDRKGIVGVFQINIEPLILELIQKV